eukprot:CFRG7954T1
MDGGDDLDDGLMIGSDIDVSDAEAEDEYEMRPPSPSLSLPVVQQAKMGKIKGDKRGSDYLVDDEAEDNDAGAPPTKKSKKKKSDLNGSVITGKQPKGKSKQDKWAEKERVLLEQITGTAEAQAEYVWSEFMRERGDEMTQIELEEVTFNPRSCFQDPPEKYIGEKRELSDLRPFMKGTIDQWKTVFSRRGLGAQKACKTKGAPNVIIVTHTAIGAADIYKELKEFSQVCRVAKLFAKHFKVEEQVKYLQQHAVRIAVGTPNRIHKLIEEGALNLSNLTYILVDTRRDVKNQNLFNVKQIRADFLRDLCAKHIFPLMGKNQTKMMLF